MRAGFEGRDRVGDWFYLAAEFAEFLRYQSRVITMSYFYFDETIQERGQFIIGAFVCSVNDISAEVFSALEKVGLRPKVDEFKSGVRMDRNPEQQNLRAHLSKLLQSTKIGVVVLPLTQRSLLGNEAIFALEKLLVANQMDQGVNEVFLDQGITIKLDIFDCLVFHRSALTNPQREIIKTYCKTNKKPLVFCIFFIYFAI